MRLPFDFVAAVGWLLALLAPMAGLWAGFALLGPAALFYVLAACAVLPAFFIIITQDIVRAAFWLLMSLASFAGFYLLLGADFLAIIQVLVYLGGIMILILFGVMLTARDPVFVARQRKVHLMIPGLVTGLVVAGASTFAIMRAFPDREVFARVVTEIADPGKPLLATTRAHLPGAISGEGTTFAVPGGRLAAEEKKHEEPGEGHGDEKHGDEHVDEHPRVSLSNHHDLPLTGLAPLGPAVEVGMEGVSLVGSATLVLPIQSGSLDPQGRGTQVTVRAKAGGEERDLPGRSSLVVETGKLGRFVVALPNEAVTPAPTEPATPVKKDEGGEDAPAPYVPPAGPSPSISVPATAAGGGVAVIGEDYPDRDLRGTVVAIAPGALAGNGWIVLRGVGTDATRTAEGWTAVGRALEVSLEGTSLTGEARIVLPFDEAQVASNRDRRQLRVQRQEGSGIVDIVPRVHAVVAQVSGPGVYQPVAPFGYTGSAIGFLFLTDFVLPFEIASVLLLVALIGAAYIARKHRVD